MDMISAIRAGTFNNLQLNAGAFIMNFDMSSYTTAAALRTALQTALATGTNVLGATRGGGTFVIDRETRDPDIDGRRYRFKGGTFVDSVDAHLTGTLVELKPAILARLMASGRATTSGAKTTITMSTTVAASDYINTLTWVGDLADGGVIAITLKNALNALPADGKGQERVSFGRQPRCRAKPAVQGMEGKKLYGRRYHAALSAVRYSLRPGYLSAPA